jgi:hypothetical protein
MGHGVLTDILGPWDISINGEPSYPLRKVLNVIGSAVAATDNPGRGRTDLSLGIGTLAYNSLTRSFPGEWQPLAVTEGMTDLDLLRVQATVAGVIMTGFDVSGEPTQSEKYLANYGANPIELRPPTTLLGGHAYFADSYTLRINETVHLIYDSEDGVYRILGAVFSTFSYLAVGGAHLTVNGDRLHVG